MFERVRLLRIKKFYFMRCSTDTVNTDLEMIQSSFQSFFQEVQNLSHFYRSHASSRTQLY